MVYHILQMNHQKSLESDLTRTPGNYDGYGVRNEYPSKVAFHRIVFYLTRHVMEGKIFHAILLSS